MGIRTSGASVVLITVAAFAFTASATIAQEDTIPKQQLRSPATVRGVIGGEAHDSYSIEARQGQTLSVRISWKRVEENRAEFTVSDSPDFFSGAPVSFGEMSHQGKRWKGVVPTTRPYYIYVVAHPIADYTLRVTIK